jgi:hypothetical protein
VVDRAGAGEGSGEFERMLTGGHPNSLGRTEEVVDLVLADRRRIEDLLDCYGSEDEVVRLRVSSALKRVSRRDPDLFTPWLDRYLDEVAGLNQPSARWTLSQISREIEDRMNAEQRVRAEVLMKQNLSESHDWIVLAQTAETLGRWAADDEDLRAWLRPRLEDMAGDTRKSVAGKAQRVLASLEAP